MKKFFLMLRRNFLCFSLMPLLQLQTSVSCPFLPLQTQLVPNTGVKQGRFSWAAPRPQGTSSCNDLKRAALQCGSFVWSPAQLPTGLQPTQGTGTVVELHPLTFTATRCPELLWEDCPSGGEERRLVWEQRVTDKPCEGCRKSHTNSCT